MKRKRIMLENGYEVPEKLFDGTVSFTAIGIYLHLMSLDEPVSLYELCGGRSKQSVESAIESLKENGLLDHMPKLGNDGSIEEASFKIKEEVIKRDASKTIKCPWCGEYRYSMHKHHFPVPKKNGGMKIVKICAACHADFHKLEGTHSNPVSGKRKHPAKK